MFRAFHLLPAACLTLAGAVAAGAAQAPPAKVVTTSSGVYTAAQAARGEQTYMNICVACHPAGTYTAPAFRQKWDGAPLSQLFGLISHTMPKEEPGTLTPEEYAQVLAYLLKINGAPAGKTELPADAAPLKKIRIAMPTAGNKARGK
ncbi:MAG TPA: cytochrome c [Vicinamibacterales bacterium]|nr:cytochrome c [Vicinamibacterales bacterium]